jgi:cold shock CspA family protein
MDAQQWKELGAQFTPTPDGEGEEPGLAVGTLGSGSASIQFGILDYGEDQTFLLVPASGEAKEQLARRAVEALVEAGIVEPLDVLDEASPYALAGALDERITALEQSVGEALAEAQPAAEPVAVDIVVVSGERRIPIETKRDHVSWQILGTKNRHFGTIKSFDRQSGKVYIEPADGSRRIFAKRDRVIGKAQQLAEGATVEFRYSIDREGCQPDEHSDVRS